LVSNTGFHHILYIVYYIFSVIWPWNRELSVWNSNLNWAPHFFLI